MRGRLPSSEVALQVEALAWASPSWYLHITPLSCSGNRERYGGTEFSETDLVDKSKIDIVVAR